MTARNKTIAVTAALALSVSTLSSAQEAGFSYLEGGFTAGFVNDVEGPGTISGIDSTFELETDAGGGGFINGAWQFGENLHLFGDYLSTSQDLEVNAGASTVEGDFDVVRWRIGIGYAHPLSSETALYGRLSYDNVEFKDIKVTGFNLDADVDEGGIGGEFGVLWAATPTIHVQGHLRYTSVGEIASNGSDDFDSDVLIGVNGRWYFRPEFALVTGYEFGSITTWNLGLRYAF